MVTSSAIASTQPSIPSPIIHAKRDRSTSTRDVRGRELYRRTRHAPVAAEHAAVAGLRLEPRAAAGAVPEEQAGVVGHVLDARFPAARAREGALPDHGSRSVAGKPASLTAFASDAAETLSGSYFASARLVARSAFASSTPGTRISAFLTVTGHSEQNMLGTSSTAVFGSPASAGVARTIKASSLSREIPIGDRRKNQRLCRDEGRPESNALPAPAHRDRAPGFR